MFAVRMFVGAWKAIDSRRMARSSVEDSAEGGSSDLPHFDRCEAEGIAYLIHRPRF